MNLEPGPVISVKITEMTWQGLALASQQALHSALDWTLMMACANPLLSSRVWGETRVSNV